jgi:hypothetical protein
MDYESTLLCVCIPPPNCLRRVSLRRERLEKRATPVDYSERAAVRREQCDMTPKVGIMEPEEMAVPRQRLSKHEVVSMRSESIQILDM